MKRYLPGIVVALLLVLGSGMAQAEENNGVSVGMKFWFNDWSQSAPGTSITSDATMLLGPAIEVNFPNYVFLEASYLVSASDYSFSDGTRIGRQDFDLAVGYWIIPEFGVLAGYKESKFDGQDQFGNNFTQTLYGPIIGMNLRAPVDEYLSFYGKLDYLFTTFKDDTSGFQEDSPGWIFEFGVKYAFTRQFTGSLGYKYETNEGNTSNVQDTFSGLTFGGMISF